MGEGTGEGGRGRRGKGVEEVRKLHGGSMMVVPAVVKGMQRRAARI
jgi:hypothetical protein